MARSTPFAIFYLGVVLLAAPACSSGATAAKGTGVDGGGGGGSGGGGGGGNGGGGSAGPSCADYGGTCLASATATCPSGTARVADGSALLCGSDEHACCVSPTKAGDVTLRGDYGLICTVDGYREYADGSCVTNGGHPFGCGIGCGCHTPTRSGDEECDCSRGLPPSTGPTDCTIFNCGTITCGVGCTCGDPKTSRCDCK